MKKRVHLLYRNSIIPFAPLDRKYLLRTYKTGDEKNYLYLMKRAGFKNFVDVTRLLEMSLPQGIFVVTYQGKIVATATAAHKPTKNHPFGGEVSWVATDPEHRNHGLGRKVTVSAINRLIDAGYEHIYIITDNWRTSSLRLYKKLGFKIMRGIYE